MKVYLRANKFHPTKEVEELTLLAKFVGYSRIEATSPTTEIRGCPMKDGGELMWETRRWQPDKVRDDAFQLVGAMRDKGFRFECRNWVVSDEWQASFTNTEKGITATITDSTLSKAIYRAALEILEPEKEY